MKCFLIAAVSADGFIARGEKHFSLDWTSEEDTHFFRKRTRDMPVVMGSTTYQNLYDTMGRGMPNRLNVVYTRSPEKFAGHDILTTQKDPVDLLKELEQKGHNEVAVIGGASIYTLFLKAGVAATLYLTVEPILFGTGITLFNESLDTKLKLTSEQKLNEGGTMLLEYSIAN